MGKWNSPLNCLPTATTVHMEQPNTIVHTTVSTQQPKIFESSPLDDDPGGMDVAHLVAREQCLVTVSFFRNFGLTDSSVKHVGMLLKHALAIAPNRRPLFTNAHLQTKKRQYLPFDDDSPQLEFLVVVANTSPSSNFHPIRLKKVTGSKLLSEVFEGTTLADHFAEGMSIHRNGFVMIVNVSLCNSGLTDLTVKHVRVAEQTKLQNLPFDDDRPRG